MNNAQFITEMSPYAQQAAAATGINAQVILAQWANETDWGNSSAFVNNFNPAGIGITGPSVSGKNYGSVAAGVQAYIDFVNNNSRYQSVKNAGINNPAAQAIALGNSGWAAGGYKDASGAPGSALIDLMGGIPQLSATPPLDTATAQAYNSDPNVKAYLDAQAAAAGAGTAASGTNGVGDPSAQTSSAPTRTQTVNGQVITGTDAQISADVEAQQLLASYGLDGLGGWAWSEITSGADNNQIVLDVMNTPQFAARYPGIIAQENYNKANPNNKVPVITVDQYQAYETNAFQAAQAAGIPPGVVTHDLIGQLIAGNVSQAEFSQRLNDATALAINSTPDQIAAFNQYFGVQDFGAFSNGHGPLTTGQIASLALDPNIAEPIIKQQITAAQVGGAATTAGVGGVSSQEALAIAQSAPGLTQSGIQSAVGAVAPYATLENARPGMGGEAAQGTITPDQLIGTQLLPTAGNLRQLQTAQEVAKAPFSGGGGYSANATGAVGTGSSKSSGAGQ